MTETGRTHMKQQKRIQNFSSKTFMKENNKDVKIRSAHSNQRLLQLLCTCPSNIHHTVTNLRGASGK